MCVESVRTVTSSITYLMVRGVVVRGRPAIGGTGFCTNTRSHDSGVSALERAMDRWVTRLEKYFAGEPVNLDVLPLDLSSVTPFRARVMCAAREIARGTVVTYAGLAHMAGNPGAVRAAASAMRHNPLPIIVPCHRVVAAAGIGGFMGSTTGTPIALKRRLLELEGARILTSC